MFRPVFARHEKSLTRSRRPRTSCPPLVELLEDRALPNNLSGLGDVLENTLLSTDFPGWTAPSLLRGLQPSLSPETIPPDTSGGHTPGGPLGDSPGTGVIMDRAEPVSAEPPQGIVDLGDQNGGLGGILPPDSHPHGSTYGEWAARWWQWAFALPAEHHPLFDTAPLSTGQTGDVWFLGGTFTGSNANRTGTVPAGTSLFFPVVNFEDSTIEEGNPNATLEQLRAVAQQQLNGVTGLFAKIDGVPVQNVTQYYEQSPLFSFQVSTTGTNIFTALGLPTPDGATGKSADVGHYLFLTPLPAGQHTLEFGTSGFDITYHLTVTPGG